MPPVAVPGAQRDEAGVRTVRDTERATDRGVLLGLGVAMVAVAR
ncbi:hypothetical protein [Pseudonocardia sp. H11422]|nr:hypothetical protein [Pseudonocardia sp. H11422]